MREQQIAGDGEFRRGWPVLVAAMIGVTTGVGAVPFYALGPSMPALQAEFGWSRSTISLALSCVALGLFVASPLAGRLCDRLSVRTLAVGSAILMACSLGAISLSGTDPWVLFVCYGAAGLLGAGTSPVTYSRALATWFEQRRGLALGAALMGTGVAGALVPLLIFYVTKLHGWRAAWMAVGCIPLLAVPFLLLWLRERPRPTASASQVATPPPESGLSQSQAFRDTRFWVLGGAIFAISCFIGGLIVHMAPMLLDAGASPEAAATAASFVGLAVIASRLTVGWLLDRIFAPLVAIGVFGLTAVGCTVLAFVGPSAAIPAALLIGFALGSEVDLVAYLTARYFGLRSYGAIYGAQYSLFVAGSAISPLIIGALREGLGSYVPALIIAAGVIFTAGLTFLLLGRYPVHAARAMAA